MVRQLSLFPESCVDEVFETNVKRHRYELQEIDIGDITFASGQNESIHRWYRLTPSFSPSLVRYFFNYFEVGDNSLVLDPFSGRGTTVIECQKRGIPAIGLEINPLLQRVGEYSLIWRQDSLGLMNDFTETLKGELSAFAGKNVEETASAFDTTIPNIHNVFRWWKPDVLRNLIVARQIALRSEFYSVREYLWLAVNNASLDCANIHRNHPTITFDDQHNRSINVFDTIYLRVSEIAADICSLSVAQLNNNSLGRIELWNSCCSLANNHPCYQNVTTVITSPPYPNRYSYVHQTRPQLHFMEVIRERNEATEIDLNTIGGTWGKATSNLMKSLIVPNDDILELLDYFPLLRERNILMCNYATKYFLDLHEHIQRLRQFVYKDFSGAYIVGNSRLSGVEIFTEVILARLFEMNGFKVEKIIVFRKRGGRKRLYETAVIVKV
ncbi:site-specific DNA-methyltransferase [Argonema galeatum]|uniref:site-specific DNA-methyltransferase n=1 Tax=Argonema galeatum TaxID=2942762 RepID=UPI0020132FE4|nr:site-specific DNA-methyltransferase [Argonema galeatum]